MRTHYIIILIVFLPCILPAQDSLVLSDCYKAVLKNYPAVKQKFYASEASALKLKNISAGYLPKIDLNGQVTYQSDVTEISMPEPAIDFGTALPPGITPKIVFPPMESPAKDQYKITLDLSQVIYDGGLSSAMRDAELAGLAADTQQVEVTLYQVKERVNQVYFSILLYQDKLNLLQIVRKDLEEKVKTMESGVKNGVVLPTSVDVLKAELIRLEQQKTELEYARKAAYAILSELMGEPVSESTLLKIPEIVLSAESRGTRPEYKYFELQEMKLSASQSLVKRKHYPRVTGFAQAGYGKPGLNLFKNEFDSWYLVGAKLSWNVWDWHQNSREIKMLDIQKGIIATQREIFDKNLNIQLLNEQSGIDKYGELIRLDLDLVALRESITKRSASQMENGVITSSEYLTDLTGEIQARMNLFTHKLLLVQAKLNYQTLKGNIE